MDTVILKKLYNSWNNIIEKWNNASNNLKLFPCAASNHASQPLYGKLILLANPKCIQLILQTLLYSCETNPANV